MTWMPSNPSEIDYTYGYYRELCPTILRLACLHAGFTPAPDRPLRYLELGFGQGVAINIHAAANRGEFWGTDFNPGHTAHALGLAEASGAEVTLVDDTFAAFAVRPDLPDFDIIALHGVWTWISDNDGQIVVDLIRRKLRVGGMVYVSYNCLPGMAPMLPLRNLMKLHSDLAGSEAGGLGASIDGAMTFARSLVDAKSLYFGANPNLEAQLKILSGQTRDYLAHEYFVPDWRVTGFADFAAQMAPAKLSFAASAHLLSQIDAINLAPEGQQMLAGIAHPVLREATRDCLTNQGFRRDIFIKGPRRLSAARREAALRAQTYILVTPARDVPPKVTGLLGDATVPEALFGPLLAALAAEGYSAKSTAQLLATPGLDQLTVDQLHEILLLLTGAGHLHPTQAVRPEAQARCRAYNQHVIENNAVGNSAVTFLASPVIGGAVHVVRLQQLCLLGMQQGFEEVSALTNFVWQRMSSLGERIIKNGQILDAEADNIAELQGMVGEFLDQRLPILKALGVA